MGTVNVKQLYRCIVWMRLTGGSPFTLHVSSLVIFNFYSQVEADLPAEDLESNFPIARIAEGSPLLMGSLIHSKRRHFKKLGEQILQTEILMGKLVGRRRWAHALSCP